MSAVPDKVLNWLYSVLTSEYHDVNRTYSDVAESLSHFPSLSPRTEVYTYENGASALLLLVSGTIPVQFRGATYRFPIALWVPHAYPRESPMVYVTPAQDMLVRPGQHVSGDGKVYHPYLAQWGMYWDKSSLLDFLGVLRGVFSKEPPVISKQQVQQQTIQPTPPPVPPPPEEWRRSQHLPQQNLRAGDSGPPPVPPKGVDEGRNTSAPPNLRPHSFQNGPPPPPLPQQITTQNHRTQQWQHATAGAQPPGGYQQNPPQRQGSTSSTSRPFIPPPQPLPPHLQNQSHELESPVSPMTPAEYSQRFRPSVQQPSHIYQEPQQPAYQQNPPPQQAYNNVPPQPQIRKPAQPVIDLLSSPLDVTLPSQTGDQTPLAAPPIPPNPEKDALLHALSQTLTSQARQVLESNTSAVAALTAQQTSLRNAHSILQSELEQLQILDQALESNERILRDTMREAEQVMRDASGRRRPEVDEILVCPTVVGGQLYALVAEERACGEARLALARGVDKGRVGLDVFVRQNRSLAREEFLKKALIKKVARGMGLDLERWLQV
ncbi:UEV-domain-containing protein [Tothia fuscella]|uniref:UEV-domain-containing protein n=1 Tax=Tothia fuscella TaxID=1048955 RepID=A0A9P4NK63_9PEZI|nr:UEV-domain-containing protein [Tothia fuscella]